MLVKTSSKFSLTSHLLSSFPDEYTTATQHPFLLAAAEGRLPKDVLSKWLANDRLYIHSYIRAAGKLLSSIDLPQEVPKTEAPETQLVDWLIEALAGVRREEKFFIEVAGKYGLDVEIGTEGANVGMQSEEKKLPGLVMIEGIFAGITEREGVVATAELPPSEPLPWLEGAVTFWGTERCYLDAWSWAKSKQALAGGRGDAAREDADGGALRNEFIPNWSSMEFAQFVGRLGGLIDFAVAETVERAGEGGGAARDAIIARVEGKWKSLLAAEATFWPDFE
ncbi:hypothetical protein QBC34DRAFT_419272 [Podospora aff. communis PSN243]|uniref:Thiaminase-2/PQQC domain-containing protein n=1 Tax=Podospora aff. communis PSN243 TaxID=3040156 RepID=A0AAV9FXK4_9PEZI|nr:hypothetical protein QBC34DRAFT_419272 [Podospora aff. communis PSN243]